MASRLLFARRAVAAVRPMLQRRAMATEAEASKVSLTFTSASKAHFSETPVHQVNVPSLNGDFGILANHVPALAVLKPGVVSVFTTPDSESKFFVSSGTVTVNEDSTVQILTEESVPLADLDLSTARSNLDKYTQQAASASSDKAKAEAEIAVDVYAAMVKALE